MFTPKQDHVTLSFSVKTKPVTKGTLGEIPDIRDIHVAIFDESGYLMEYNRATYDLTPISHDGHNDYTYTVPLPLCEHKCTLHFIANGPTSIPFGNEASIISNILTHKGGDKEDGYWQTRILENGVIFDEELFKTEHIVQLPATFASDNNLLHIPLVRNFAKLTVRVDPEHCSNFDLDGFVVINEPLSGSIAPYSRDFYVPFLTNFETYTYENLKAAYDGFLPATAALDESIPSIAEFEAQKTAAGAFYYLYERPSSAHKPIHLIMKGDYEDPNGVMHYNRYFKINIIDGDAVSPFYRNMQYDIIITRVSQVGSETPEGAESNINSVDVTSEVLQELPSYQDGDATIFVEYTSMTYVSSGTYQVKFRYVNDGANQNSTVELTLGPGSVITSASITSLDDGSDDDGYGGWGTITYTVTSPGPLIQSQSMKITSGSMSRDIKISLLGPQNLTLSLNPDAVEEVIGAPTTLTIGLPLGLPSSMFPLDLGIESDRLSLSPQPGVQLPVVTGPSIVPAKGGQNSFHFIKTLDRLAYLDLVAAAEESGADRVYIDAALQSNVTESACTIFVDNPFFNVNSIALGNFVPGNFTNLSFEGTNVTTVSGQRKIVMGEDMKVSFRFNMDKSASAPVYLALTNLMLDPAYPGDLAGYTFSGGKNIYYINNGTAVGTHTVHLITTSDSGEVSAELSSYQFFDASLDAGRVKLAFASHGFSAAANYINIGEREVGYYFNYNTSALGETVIVTVKGGTIDTVEDPRFSRTSDSAEGYPRYIFTPTNTTTQNQNFNITTSFGQSVAVTLESNRYDTVSDSKSRRIEIAANKLRFSGTDVNKTTSMSIYLNGDELGTFTKSRTSTQNNNAINIVISDSDNLTSTDQLNFRYTRIWSTYNAYVSAQAVSNISGTLTLNFSN